MLIWISSSYLGRLLSFYIDKYIKQYVKVLFGIKVASRLNCDKVEGNLYLYMNSKYLDHTVHIFMLARVFVIPHNELCTQ